VELREFHQSFMGGNFVFCRIAQDAFNPVALADEVDETGVGSVKHRVTRILFSSCFGKHRETPQ